MEKFDIIYELKNKIKKMLNLKEFDQDANLSFWGMNSIMIMKISAYLKKKGCKITFGDLILEPTLSNWIKLIESTKEFSNDIKHLQKENIKNTIEEFNLTDVQYAYWAGRQKDQILGDIGCHAYFEFDGYIKNVEKLKSSWQILQKAQPMLRAKFTDDGRQVILGEQHIHQLVVNDLIRMSIEECEEILHSIRKKLSHQKLNVQEGEAVHLECALLPDGKSRLFLDVDLLVADVASIHILIMELTKAYKGEPIRRFEKDSFKQYLDNKSTNAQLENLDKEYWGKIIDTYPNEAPSLPLRVRPEEVGKISFTRKSKRIEAETWGKLKTKAMSYGMTPAMFLLTVYSSIISRWTNQQKFIINIPLFNRDEENYDVNGLIADFTNLLLLDVSNSSTKSFLDYFKEINSTFISRIAHSSYSGVQVQRDINRANGGSEIIAPIVFACNIDFPFESDETKETLGKLNYMISQTPQVWLDFQSFTDMGDLILCWDYVEQLFEPKVINEMFSSMVAAIETLVLQDSWQEMIDVLPENQKKRREGELLSILPLRYPKKCLYSEFLVKAEKTPGLIAIIDSSSGRKIKYGELRNIGLRIAKCLLETGIKPGDYIGITLPRGYQQIFTILGILFAGAVYVPITENQPKERRKKIYEQIGIRYVVSDTRIINNVDISEGIVKLININQVLMYEESLIKPIEIPYDSSAYVIMTSGSTGIPKGVEIAHYSAFNTISDLNSKYDVNKQDTLLMVSAIDFDLSVYDIFGILSAGGKIISLNEENYKNPDIWLQMIEQYKVTMWNSVPILFDMLTTMSEGKKIKLNIRLVYLSGDWIPTSLPGRFYAISDAVSLIVAMGGATEASIWSNYIEVPRMVPADWISIPYGKALNNQVYRVVDNYGRICPNYVEGELWIGGIGVAKCYRGDFQLTEKKFILDSDDFRWYKTGDNGRTWNDGTIEFLGRKDNQVKIKGHRIELGEVENAIKNYPGVQNVVVNVIEYNENDKKIVAFLQLKKEAAEFYLYKNTYDISFDKILEISSKRPVVESVFGNRVNTMTIDFILDAFEQMGVIFDHSVDIREIVDIGQVCDKMKSVIYRWIALLVREGKIIKEKNGYLRMEMINTRAVEKSGKYLFYSEIFNSLLMNINGILRGEINPIEFFYRDGFNFRPDILVKHLPGYSENKERILKLIHDIAVRKKRDSLRILEIGSRDKEFTKNVIEQNTERITEYVYLDNTKFFQENYLEIIDDFNGIEYRVGALEDIKVTEPKFDIIIMLNSLHRFNNIDGTLQQISRLLKSEGYLVGSEINRELLISDVIPCIIESGFTNIDLSLRGGSIIPAVQVLKRLFENSGYQIEYITEEKQIPVEGNMIFVVTQKDKSELTFSRLMAYLEEKIPSYMMPFMFYEVDKFPLNKNGKIDHKNLCASVKDNVNITYHEKKLQSNNPQGNETQMMLTDIYEKVLHIQDISASDNYFSLGGDSLIATRIIGALHQHSINISIKNIFENPTIFELAQFIIRNQHELQMNNESKFTIEKNKENEPFPLSDVQFAYWIGRKGAFNMGQVSTHCYFEFDCVELNVPRLQKVWNAMITYHGMLRAVVSNSGEQRIMSKVPIYLIQTANLSDACEQDRDNYLQETREKMSNQVLNANKWPLFDLKLTIIDQRNARLHVSFDNLILDGWSMFHILDEMARRYYADDYKEEKLQISFRDYIISLNKLHDSDKYKGDKKYWLMRLNSFSKSPILPLAKSESELSKYRFCRRHLHLKADEWEKVKILSQCYGITPTVFLLTLFSDNIRKSSLNKNFAINLTQFDRNFQHPQINKLVGDFTKLTLLETKYIKNSSFIDRAKAIQRQLTSDLEHSLYSAVEFERELRQRDGNMRDSIMPIVFTSGLGINQWDDDRWIGKLSYNISQTPQVWLDHQVIEQNKGLTVNWDAVDELLTTELLDRIFDSYKNQIYFYIADSQKMTLVDNEEDWGIFQDNKISNEIDTIKLEAGTKHVKYNSHIDSNKYKEKLIGIWGKLLKTSIQDSSKTFFELGGDSLGMVKLVNQLNTEFKADITIIDIVEHNSIDSLADFFSNRIDEGTI